MKRFGLTALVASAMFAAISMSANAQQTACSLVGKSERYNLIAYPYDGIPSFGYKMVSPGTTCVDGKPQYVIADTAKPLGSMTEAEAVVDAIRTLNKYKFTDQADIAKLLAYVAEVEKADAARPKKKVADQK